MQGLKQNIVWGIAIGLILGYIFFDERLESIFFSVVDRWRLAHYQSAVLITQAEFDKVSSESVIFKEKEEVESIPGMTGYLLNNHLVPKSQLGGADMYSKWLILDVPRGVYYLRDKIEHLLNSDFAFNNVISLKKFSKNFQPMPHASIPYDIRWNEKTSGFACFSCGCGCYMDRDLKVANDKFYVIVSGKDFAIRPEYQGIYYLNGNTWERVTPKIDNDFKISNQGCTLYYEIKSKYFRLNTCSS